MAEPTRDHYQEIFNQRGGSYHLAMQSYPEARSREFELAVSFAEPQGNETIVDLPAGGGYLKQYLTQNSFPVQPGKNYFALETAATFAKSAPGIRVCQFHELPFDDQAVDVVFSIAALHHVENRYPVYKEIARILKPGGRFIIADVKKDSIPALFLNGFVNRTNSMGHEGLFPNPAEEIPLLQSTGFQSTVHSRNFSWSLPGKDPAIYFAKHLFGLDQATNDQIWQTLVNELGATWEKDVQIPWALDFYINRTPYCR